MKINQIIQEGRYKEIEFVCVNPEFPDATDPTLQQKLYSWLKTIPGVIPLFQDQSDYSDGQSSLTAIYKGSDTRRKILTLAKRLGVQVDLEQPVSDDYVDRAIRGEHEGQIITEGKNHPVIVVDIQPAYATTQTISRMHNAMKFVHNQTGPVLMFVNAEQDGLTDDTVFDIQHWWDEQLIDMGYGKPEEEGDDENGDYFYNPAEMPTDWRRFQIVDKGYGWFRPYMDNGVPESTIIQMIRHLYQNRLHDARDLDYDEYVAIMGSDRLIGENFSINWTSLAQLKKFNGASLVGGGRHECLREVELLMNAFNIKYKRIDSMVYG